MVFVVGLRTEIKLRYRNSTNLVGTAMSTTGQYINSATNLRIVSFRTGWTVPEPNLHLFET